MPSVTYKTHSDAETIELGRRLARELPPGVILLTGNLGAGKTTFAKGFIPALTPIAENDIASPTFTLIHDYGEVVHIDLYRLETEREVEGLGLDEIIDRAKFILIEWGERFGHLFPGATRIEITASAENERKVLLHLP